VFAYCYGRIFHVIRRHRTVPVGHVGRDVNVATTSLDQNTGQAAPGAKLSRTELNVIKTMVTIITCFIIFWSTASIANLLHSLGVSTPLIARADKIIIFYIINGYKSACTKDIFEILAPDRGFSA